MIIDEKNNLKIFTDNIEGAALNQVYDLVKQPAFAGAKVRIMPDVHAGAGCVIGFTANLGDKVIPNIVGVDIGCGVRVIKFGKDTEIDLQMFDDYLKKTIPSGMAVNSKVQETFELGQLYCYKQLLNPDRLALGLGSLGGGNHFIEIDKDDDEYLYLVIHTGSRNLGKQVAQIYQNRAIEYCQKDINVFLRYEIINRLKAEGRKQDIEQELKSFEAYHVPKELCFLEGIDREYYLHDMRLCQEYAVKNRKIIASRLISHFNLKVISEFESVHNYIDNNDIVRKGAVSAHKGQQVIIPLNMRDGSILGIGKGNDDWNESAPHGAGRVMSRSESKRTLQLSDFQESMKNIFSTTVNESTIDESPMAYKNAEEIINAVNDTVEITALIKPIYNFKAAD